jgi:superfamily I DNA and/or RNA helicase
MSEVRITSVDNYQGEENDFILLSLVRSNKNGEIGFLAASNRACVALSRAKVGFYIIGNGTLLVNKNNLWRKVIDVFKSRGRKK